MFRKGLTWQQKMQYFSSVSFFFSGFVVLMNALLPLFYFYFGLVPFRISTMVLAAVFLPYMIVTMYVLQQSTNFNFSFKSLTFSMSGFNIHIKAFISVLTGKKEKFSVTSKKKLEGNFLRLVMPQIIYIILACIGVGVGYLRWGLTPSLITNTAWAFLNVAVFLEFIGAALPQPHHETQTDLVPARQPVLNN